MARQMADPKKGSSPLPSLMRPHRGSRQMSTMGLKVQQMPSAVASIEAMRAELRMASISQLIDMAKGMGKTVS